MRFFYCLLLAPHLLFAAYSSEETEYLCTAVKYGNDKQVAKSLANNADPDAHIKNEFRRSLALQAYLDKNINIMKLLFKHGANKGLVLEAAVKQDDFATAQFLIDEGAELKEELLFFAGRYEPAMLEWLLKQGLDVNAVNNSTALLFRALFEIYSGLNHETIKFHPSYPMLHLLKRYRVNTSLHVYKNQTIFQYIDSATDISPEEKENLKEILNQEVPVMIKSSLSAKAVD